MPFTYSDLEKTTQRKQEGIASEFVAFLNENKRFWLIPLLLVALLMALLLLLPSAPVVESVIYSTVQAPQPIR